MPSSPQVWCSLRNLVAGEDDQFEGLLSFCALLGPVLYPGLQATGAGHVLEDVEPVALGKPEPGAYRVVPMNPEEAIVDFDPDDTTQYLEGVDYPASKEDLASAAEGNGAPEELVEKLRTLGRPNFSGPDEVLAELESSPTSG